MLFLGSEASYMHQVFDISIRISPILKQGRDFLKIGNGFQIIWTLFFPKSVIQIRTDSNMICVACKLTDMIQMIKLFKT